MSEPRIDKLIISGVAADNAAVLSGAASAGLVLARGMPAAAWLAASGIPGVVEVLYDTRVGMASNSWRDLLHDLVRSAGKPQTVVYVSSIQPLNLDLMAVELARLSVEVLWVNDSHMPVGFLPREERLLDGALQTIDVLNLHEKHYPTFTPALPVLLHSAGTRLDGDALSGLLGQVYPADHRIYVTSGLPGAKGEWRRIELAGLREYSATLSSAIYIPPCDSDASLESFMQVIAQLRAPEGCPWDRKQTHASLRPYLLEETYEALEQLDNNNMEGLKEELGDLLLQIALHSQIASETNTFTITQVLQHINRKIVSRHPHVFGAVSVRDDLDVVQNWEKLKELERAGSGKEEKNGLLDGIPKILPALSQAQSIQERAARVGFDWPEIAPVIAKVQEELQEVSDARDERERALELGDLLFAVVNLVRWYKVDAESSLRATNSKFRKRFAYIESEVKKAGRELPQMTLEEMDALWEESKALD